MSKKRTLRRRMIWMKQCKTMLPALALGLAVGLGVAAAVLGDRLTAPVSGVSASRLIMAHFDRTWTPEQRKEIERAERDERNVAIREKAAYSSWYWTLYLLWGLFFLTLILQGGMYTALVSAAIVLHCVFYMVNMNRWTKKL